VEWPDFTEQKPLAFERLDLFDTMQRNAPPNMPKEPGHKERQQDQRQR
jgi:hypothetical protein